MPKIIRGNQRIEYLYPAGNALKFTLKELTERLGGLVVPYFAGNIWIFHNPKALSNKQPYNIEASSLIGLPLHGDVIFCEETYLPEYFFVTGLKRDKDGGVVDEEYEDDEIDPDEETPDDYIEYREKIKKIFTDLGDVEFQIILTTILDDDRKKYINDDFVFYSVGSEELVIKSSRKKRAMLEQLASLCIDKYMSSEDEYYYISANKIAEMVLLIK